MNAQIESLPLTIGSIGEELLPVFPSDPVARRTAAMSRQAELIGDSSQLSVGLVGYGAIGSHLFQVGLGLGIAHWDIIDPGRLEFENLLPGNFPFGEDYLGAPKVQVADTLAYNLGYGLDEQTVWAHVGTAEQVLPLMLAQGHEWDVFAVATDTLSSRRETWYNFGRQSCKRWWLDFRIGGHLCTAYALDVYDEKAIVEYQKTLEGDESELPCGQKATAYISGGWIRAYAGTILAAIINGQTPPPIQRYDGLNFFHLQTRQWYSS